MKPFIQISMPNGMVFEIPTQVIADHRTACMQEAHPEEFHTLEAASEDTRELFTEDSWHIKDWAANNMNWDELQPHAKLIRFKQDTDHQWYEGEFTYHDMPALLGELDGATIMHQPVELIMQTMATASILCNVTVLNGANGQPCGAFALIVGDAGVVNSYLTALQFTGNVLTGQDDAAGSPATTAH